MTDKQTPSNLDWVTARANCSILHVFRELENGVRVDVEKAQSLVLPNETTKFYVTKMTGNRFSAVRVKDPITCMSESVHFVCANGEIRVLNDDQHVVMAAGLTLTNEGECKLEVGNEQLYEWQFRRKALEGLFFHAR